MWQRFTERARKAVFYAQEEAGKWGDDYVSTEHLLLGLIREDDSFTARLLDRIGVSRDHIRSEVERQMTRGEGQKGKEIQLTLPAKQVVDLAYAEAKRLKNNYIGGEHLLLGLIGEGEGLAAKVLTGLGLTLDATREQVRKFQKDSEAKTASEELLSLDEAVKFLGTSKPTLYRLLGQDEIKGLKVGRQWRFRCADLIAYMERGPVAVAAAPQEDLDMELAFFAEQLGQAETDGDGDAEAKTIRLSHQILQLAIQSRATDIHLEPTKEDFLLRLRFDGVLQETRRLPASVRESLTARFKIMADMDVTQKRSPQDGRIPVRQEDKDFDVRVASIPSVYGEALTLLVLARQDALLGLDTLGLDAGDLAQVRDFLHQPNGIVLATGPTGSGKTTFLYSCVQEIAGGEKKTMTLEDPVEHVLAHTTQVEINQKAGLSFQAGLRAALRQDPDVILVGEAPNAETVTGMIEASLSGRLVLSCLHTSDAPSALLRMLDMGVEPYLIPATVAGVVAPRLCRKICEACKTPVDLSAEPVLNYVVRLAGAGGYQVPADAVFYQGRGCDQCRGRGYKGRIGLYEVLTMSDALTEALLRRASGEELTAIAVSGGMKTLLADGIRKAVDGQTTIKEVVRVVSASA